MATDSKDEQQQTPAVPGPVAGAIAAMVPRALTEASATALEWPRLRAHIAGLAQSPLGREWTLRLEPSADRNWIEAQQQRTAEIRGLLTGGGSFEFHGLFDPTALLEETRLEGVALEGTQINQLLHVVERLAAWRTLLRGNTQTTDMPAIAEFRARARAGLRSGAADIAR